MTGVNGGISQKRIITALKLGILLTGVAKTNVTIGALSEVKMIIWFRWKNGEIVPKWKKINFAEERKKELYRRINKMLGN